MYRVAIEGTIGARMEREIKIQKSVTRTNLRKPQSDFAYWQSQPYLARLAALEQIRQEYHRWRGGAESRLQRVYRIAKR